MNPFSFHFEGFLSAGAGMATVVLAFVLAGRAQTAYVKDTSAAAPRPSLVPPVLCAGVGAFATAVGLFGRRADQVAVLDSLFFMVPLAGLGLWAIARVMFAPVPATEATEAKPKKKKPR